MTTTPHAHQCGCSASPHQCPYQNATVAVYYNMEAPFKHYGNPMISYDEAKAVPLPADEAPQLPELHSLKIPGGPKVRVYVMERDKVAKPLVVFFHGGGFVSCSVRTHDVLCAQLAKQGDAVVVSVEYRLAPQHTYPAAHDDAVAAAQWAVDNADKWGADPKRLCLVGDSCGGTLALHCAVNLKGKVAMIGLAYPWCDFTQQFDSYLRFDEHFGMRRESLQKCIEQYRGGSGQEIPAPLQLDLKGLPPVTFVAAQCDVLVDEGEALQRKLEDAGVQVNYKVFMGVPHDFMRWTKVSPTARAAVEFMAEGIRKCEALA